MITSTKLEKIADIGGMACEACHDDDFAPVVLGELETLLDADGAVFYDMSGPFARPVFGDSHYRKIERQFGELYREHYNDLDPCFNTLTKDHQSPFLATSSTMRAVTGVSDYVESEYYQDFLRPQSIHTSIIFTLSNDAGLLGLFGFQRPTNQTAFDDESHLLVRLAAAPIVQALDRRRYDAVGKSNGLSVTIGGLSLSDRQIEVAKYITLGLTNVEIAKQLNISPKTVENHLTKIYKLTKTHNRVTLAQSLSVLLNAALSKSHR